MKLSVKKLLPFLILLFVSLGCTEEARRQSREKAEAKALEQKAEKAREAIADQLSKKFDIYPDCLFRFWTGGSQSKTLYVKNCSPKKGITKPDDFLEAEDRKNLKTLGFEEIEIDSWESAWKAYTTLWQFNDDATLSFVKYK